MAKIGSVVRFVEDGKNVLIFIKEGNKEGTGTLGQAIDSHWIVEGVKMPGNQGYKSLHWR